MLLKVLAVLALTAAVFARPDEDTEKLVQDIFGNTEQRSSIAPSAEEKSSPCNEKIAKCVHYYLCDYGYKADNEEIHNLVHETAGGECPSYLDTCCLLEAIVAGL